MISSHFCTPALFPVIHVKDPDTSKANAELAVQNNCAGVFLINHGDANLGQSFDAVRAEFPDLWVGLNMLGVEPIEALAIVREMDVQGLWTDGLQDRYLEEWSICRKDWNGVHFGGVAFKYQPQEGTLEDQAKRAVPLVDVLTTSGDATGQPPSVEKVRAIRDVLPRNKLLAVASGVNVRNMGALAKQGADAFLVASSISRDFHHLDPMKLHQMAFHMP